MSENEHKGFQQKYARRSVPDTTLLRANILAITQDLEQHSLEPPFEQRQETQSKSSTVLFFNWLPRQFQPQIRAGIMVGAALIITVLSLWSSSISYQRTGSVNDKASLIDTDLPLYELEFQEILLRQDELMFAQL